MRVSLQFYYRIPYQMMLNNQDTELLFFQCLVYFAKLANRSESGIGSTHIIIISLQTASPRFTKLNLSVCYLIED